MGKEKSTPTTMIIQNRWKCDGSARPITSNCTEINGLKVEVIKLKINRIMPKIYIDSPWLKANLNIKQGDRIRFVSEGIKDKDDKWVFDVAVIDKRSDTAVRTKKFSLNKVNLDAIVSVFGTDDSERWVGQEMEVYFVVTENPRSREMVDAIRLKAPGAVTPKQAQPKGEIDIPIIDEDPGPPPEDEGELNF